MLSFKEIQFTVYRSLSRGVLVGICLYGMHRISCTGFVPKATSRNGIYSSERTVLLCRYTLALSDGSNLLGLQ